jgi:hypothetical protein
VNRRKQIADRRRGDGQARTLSNLNITIRHLDADYDIFKHALTRGETGLLKVFSLVPKTPGNPSFEARIDDGSPGRRRDPELDFDIRGVGRALERAFKNNRAGYIGHHSERSANQNQRLFDVEIGTPASKVFEGEVSFNVEFSVEINISANTGVRADAFVIRASRLTRIRNWLRGVYAKLRRMLHT